MGGRPGEAATVGLNCPAKLNLFLDVVGRRADGFHELVTVFLGISLSDDVFVRATPADAPTLTLRVEPPVRDVPADATNLAFRAASALWEEAGRPASLEVKLTKAIPVGGGLGGGSADAAGTLRAVNLALRLGKSADELRAVAATLGSDVPFLVEGGAALARGRGEILEPVPSKPVWFLLLVPTFPLATAAVYKALPKVLPPPRHPGPTLAALAAGDAAALGRVCENALFEGARRVDPRVDEVMSAARAVLGPRVHLTGSGSTFFAPLPEYEAEGPPDVSSVPHLSRVLVVRGAGSE